MNTKDNARRRESRRRIREALIAELDERGALERVTVTALCSRAGINRSTFYASYHDVFDLAEQTCAELSQGMNDLFRRKARDDGQSRPGANHLEILRHIYENRESFLLGFKLGIGDGPILRWDPSRERFQPVEGDTAASQHATEMPAPKPDYHTEFFRAGFNAIVRLWLETGCRETPEELYQAIQEEYLGRSQAPCQAPDHH